MDKFLNKKIFTYFLLVMLFLLSIYLIDILVPFLIGLIVAYLLDPFVDWLERKKIKRAFGSSIVLFIFFFLTLTIFFLIFPILIIQVKSFLTEFPLIIDNLNSKLVTFTDYLHQKFLLMPSKDLINNFGPSISKFITSTLSNIISSSTAIFNIITLLIVTPIVSWYFLKDWNKILKSIQSMFSSEYKILIKKYSKDINNILDSYLRGQLIVGSLLSLYYFLSFYILDLNYSLFIGLFTGFFSFIPFLGMIISFIITCILSYLQYLDFYYLLYVLIIFSLGQFLESNFLTPNLIGKKLGLHPLIVLLSIFIFGSLFGIIGIIFAIPITSIVLLIFKKNYTYK